MKSNNFENFGKFFQLVYNIFIIKEKGFSKRGEYAIIHQKKALVNADRGTIMKIGDMVRHFHTITQHKVLVMKKCFRLGLYRQGLLHDLSKYSPAEFWTGVKFYQGNRSPNAAEREIYGFSAAWLHHKGRNKHHFEYWIDFSTDKTKGLTGNKMPLKYLLEMVCDRIAASQVYRGKGYDDGAAWEYYCCTQPYVAPFLHPDTKRLLEKLLRMLKEEGEGQTFLYMKQLLKQGKY